MVAEKGVSRERTDGSVCLSLSELLPNVMALQE